MSRLCSCAQVTVHTIAKPALSGGASGPVDADDEKKNPFHYLSRMSPSMSLKTTNVDVMAPGMPVIA